MPDQAQDLQVTPIEQWGVEAVDGFIVPLPSGKVAKVRRSLDMVQMLASGQIPNPLRGIVTDMIAEAEGNPSGVSFDWKKVLDGEALPQLMDMVNRVTCQVMIEPPVDMPTPRGQISTKPDESQEEYEARINEWVPAPGKLSVFVIDLDDKMYLFSVAQGAAAHLKSFREEPSQPVAPVAHGKATARPTKRTGGTGGKRSTKAK